MSAVTDQPDPVERQLLDEAALAVPAPRRPVAIDITSAETATALADRSLGGRSIVSVDSVRVEEALAVGADARRFDIAATRSDALRDADLVIMRLPPSLAALEEVAAAVCRLAAPGVVLLAGARIKHLNRGMNAVLEAHFFTVRASLGRQKSRVLIARDIRRARIWTPERRHHDDLGLTVVAYGGAFAGAGIDLGTRTLLDALALPPHARRAADLGCGTGILATRLAQLDPDLTVFATDDSAAACRSAADTAAANGIADRVRVQRTNLLRGVEPASLDVVVCNPPFHRGTAKDSSDAFLMITDAARALRVGGELWMVYNAHLPYLPTLRRAVGPTSIVRRTRGYLITRSVRSGSAVATA